MIRAVVGDKHRFTQGAEHIRPIEKVLMRDLAVVGEIVKGHFYELDELFAVDFWLLNKLGPSALQHIDGNLGDRVEAAAFDEDRFLVQDVRDLHYFSVGREHGRLRPNPAALVAKS